MIHRIAKSLGWMVLTVAFCGNLGCNGSIKSTPPTDEPPRDLLKPTSEEIVRIHNLNVDRFKELYGRGQAELHWRDGNGDTRFEFCRVELFWRPPRNVGVNLTKVGERFLWLGSNDSQFWIFDLASEPRTLQIGLHSAAVDGRVDSPMGLSPLMLLDLMGLGHVEANGEVRWSPDPTGWTLDARADGGPIRIVVDPKTLQIIQVTALGEDGLARLSSDLDELKTVDTNGVSPAESPKFPTRVRLRRVGSDDRVDLYFDVPTGRSGMVNENLFDIERLKKLLKPEVIKAVNEPIAGDAPDIGKQT